MDLQCHYHHMGSCRRKRCKFSHLIDSLGYCPNGYKCPIKHRNIDCPLLPTKSCNGQCTSFVHPHESPDQPANRPNIYQMQVETNNISPKKSNHLIVKCSNIGWFGESVEIIPKKSQNMSWNDESESVENIAEKQKNQQSRPQATEEQKYNNYKNVPKPHQFDTEAFQKQINSLNEDFKILEPFQQKMMQGTTLDLLIMMDITGSMGSWINVCKENIKEIISQIKIEFPSIKTRIAFIGYRDIQDKDNLDENSVLEFVEDVDIAQQFIASQKASGGGDEPEDVAGALEIATQLNWQAKARYAILIADAPCHGMKYHLCGCPCCITKNISGDCYGDRYPEGDPKSRIPEEFIEKLAYLDVHLYGIKISSRTNHMFSVFSEAYQSIALKPIQVEMIGAISNFNFYIQNTVSKTVGTSKQNDELKQIKIALKAVKENKQIEEQISQYELEILKSASEIKQSKNKAHNLPFSIDFHGYSKLFSEAKEVKFNTDLFMTDEPAWENLQNSVQYNVRYRNYFIVKDKDEPINWKKPLIQEGEMNSRVAICKNPFSSGAMRFAFYMYDYKLNQKMVAKLPKKIDEHYCIEEMKKDIEVQFICQHLVNEFNEQIVEIITHNDLLINFVHAFIIEIQSSNTKMKYYQCENFIQGSYEKYNNNDGWIKKTMNERSLIAQAFSHFSWQATCGYLMIVDLQGASSILTDPQIHCLDYLRFGKGNLGYEGILKFFFTHQCNHYCKHLNLVNPTTQTKFQQSLNKEMVKPGNSSVNTLCDLCKQSFRITYFELQQKKIESKEKYCFSCAQEMRNTRKEGTCVDCKNKFQSSVYWFNMKRTDFPIRCSKCRLSRRQMLREKLKTEQLE